MTRCKVPVVTRRVVVTNNRNNHNNPLFGNFFPCARAGGQVTKKPVAPVAPVVGRPAPLAGRVPGHARPRPVGTPRHAARAQSTPAFPARDKRVDMSLAHRRRPAGWRGS